jgi:membrane protein
MAKAKQLSAAWLQRARQSIESVRDEAGVGHPQTHWFRRTPQFIYLVLCKFAENRCPMRAAALSYTTLLALVPLLAVVLSFSKSLLHEASAELVPRLIDRAVSFMAPQLEYMPLPDNVAGPLAPGPPHTNPEARRETVRKIQSFIDNINAGALGTIGSLFLVVVAVRLMMIIESTFNDIWGVRRGRTLWRKIVYYWTTVTLGPSLILLAMYMTGTMELARLYGVVAFIPGAKKFFLELTPFVVLWLGFALMYALMPNTHVRRSAAVVGGVVAGTLWQINSMLSAMYFSRVMTYSKIYGALGIIPVLLLGLYFSWLIILFGAQVSFAAQNIQNYLQERAAEKMDETQRELLACRMMLVTCRNFLGGLKPPSAEEVANELAAPLQLVNQLAWRMAQGGVLSELAGPGRGFQPARPPETLTLADVLNVVRTHDGAVGESARCAAREPIEALLAELRCAERASTANLRFSELAAKFDLPDNQH